MSNLLSSMPLRWLLAVVAFPIGGYVGHLVGGPAATVPAALISGLIAGAVIGLGQGLALKLGVEALAIWTAVAGIALALSLAAVTAVIGQIEATGDAMLLGVASGLAIGVGQAALLVRKAVANAWLWVPASAAAWTVGWFITSSIGVALAAGWPVYGLSGALVSQVITAGVLWALLRRGEGAAPALA